MGRFRSLLLLGALLLGSCSHRTPFSSLTDEFVRSTLALSPIAATAVGYHQHNGVPLDELLDDYNGPGLDSQRAFYQDWQRRLSALDVNSLSAEEQVDLGIMRNQIEQALFEGDTLQSYRHNPTLYVELVGNALFAPFQLEYASKAQRYRQIVSRLEKIPTLFKQARANLVDAPPIWTKVAGEENAGNIDLIDKLLRENCPPELRTAYDKAATPALEAVRAFNTYLSGTLAQKGSSWRLGKEKYARKFQLVLNTGKTPEASLVEAEDELRKIRAQMQQLTGSRPVKQVLAKIASHHAAPANYFNDARRDLAETTDWVKQKNLVPLLGQGNLQVIPTPEFVRGIYAVGGFNAAPALEPKLGAFYWLTPIPANWPKDRIESKLREYNYYGLKILTIHEAMPGHYVQAEYANRIEPESRRLLRNVYGNGPYVEGWAVYATQFMLDSGYLDNSPEMRLTFLKQMLRVVSNTILDIRLQTMNMTEQQALRLMIEDTFQEREEATAKLQRAQLSSCQLPMYFVGWRGWEALRTQTKLQPAEFHARALKEGAVPLPALGALLH